MEDQDLKEIGITDASHRKKILHAARSLPKVTPHLKHFKAGLSGFRPLLLTIDRVFSHRSKRWAVMAAPHSHPGWRIWAFTSICTTSWPAATAL